MTIQLSFRAAHAGDAAALFDFIMQHGPNPWNHLPPPELRDHFAGLATGDVEAVLAEEETKLAGFVSFCLTDKFAKYQSPHRAAATHGYICEAVVDAAYKGQGIGTRLLNLAVDRMAAQGLQEIYIDRHEENLASAGMMRKAGFVEIATFEEFDRRPNGSRRTTVCRLVR